MLKRIIRPGAIGGRFRLREAPAAGTHQPESGNRSHVWQSTSTQEAPLPDRSVKSGHTVLGMNQHLGDVMEANKFSLRAEITTTKPRTLEKRLIEIVGIDAVLRTESGFIVRTTMEGKSAKDLNTSFLSALRLVDDDVRMKSKWTIGAQSELFYDFGPRVRVQSRAEIPLK